MIVAMKPSTAPPPQAPPPTTRDGGLVVKVDCAGQHGAIAIYCGRRPNETPRLRRGVKVGRKPSSPSGEGGPSGGFCYSKASSQVPRVAAFEYSVARFSKKLVCSTAFSMLSSQGSGFFSIR